VLVGGGLLLRLRGISWGLPFNFVNPDEGTVIPHAFRIAQGHVNPHFFYYPSLFFYLLAAVYRVVALFWHGHAGAFLSTGSFVIDPGPYYLTGRLVVAVLGTASIYFLYRLGREAFGRNVGLLAAALLTIEPLQVSYSHMAVTDVPATTFAVLALWLLVGAANGRGRRWLLTGAIAAGLATSCKYNLGMLLIPATVAGWVVSRPAAWRPAGALRSAAWRPAAASPPAGPAAAPAAAEPLPLSASLAVRRTHAGRARLWFIGRYVYVPMALAFVLTTPFALLDFPQFWHDFSRQNTIVARGWLGFEHIGNTYWFNFRVNLAGSLGLVLFVLALTGVAYALWRHSIVDLMLAPYVVIYFLYISSWHELPARYLLPIIPLALLLAARVAWALGRLRLRVSRTAGGQASAKGRVTTAGGKVTTADGKVTTAGRATTARQTAIVGAALLVVALLVWGVAGQLGSSLSYDRSLSGVDVRVIARQWVQTNIRSGVAIAVDTYAPPLVTVSELPYFRAADVKTAYYTVYPLPLPVPGVADQWPSLAQLRRQNVRYVIVSSLVYDRIDAAATDFPQQAAFYRHLAQAATLIKVFAPGSHERGPVIKIYGI
jgi:4-amino-4-deoxy-L-arabinose transferase-like glycosyltransferase